MESHLYVIADTHLTSDPQKRMDVHEGWENYIERIKSDWLDTVSDSDTVVIPGDITWATKIDEDIEMFRFLNDLPGKKILIKGNHDNWWKNSAAMYKILSIFPSLSLNFLRNNSFVFENYRICGCTGVDLTLVNQNMKNNERNLLRLERSLKHNEDSTLSPIVFMHFPPIMYDKNELIMSEEIFEILKRNNVKKCYYGHLHGDFTKDSFNDEYNGIKFQLISADFVQFKPVLVV